MLPEILIDHIYELVGVAIATCGLLRWYYGPRFYDIPWQPLRRVFIPLAHKIAERALGEDFYAAYSVGREEHVATLPISHDDVVDDLEDAEYVVEPLAGLKTDWHGNTEVASYARHTGPKPFFGAPTWLKRDQVHVTLFPTPNDEGTIVTAHHERNSWRPDLAEEHYRGVGMDIDRGRAMAADDLGIDVQEAPLPDNPVNK